MSLKSVNEASFEAEVLKADGPVLVDFWAPWCGPCHMVAPIMEQLAATYAGRLTVVKVNVDDSPAVSNALGVRSIPTIALFRDGEVLDGVVGAAPLAAFTTMLEKHLAPAAEPAHP